MPFMTFTASRSTTSTGFPAWMRLRITGGGIGAMNARAKRSPTSGA
jgi:hypothetical protein